MFTKVAHGALLLSAMTAGSSHPVRGEGGIPPIRLVQDTVVSLHVQLTLRGPEGVLGTAEATLRGLSGETMVLERALGDPSRPVAVVLTIVPRADESGACRLEVRSEVSRGQPVPTVALRTLTTASERLNLVDIWADRADRIRLVAAFSASWEIVPRLTTLAPESEPVELLFEFVNATDPARPELLEQHRLSGIVGSPSRYAFTRAPGRLVSSTGRALSAGDEPAARLVLEALPRAIEGGLIDLALRLQLESKDPGRPAPPLDLEVSDRVPPGSGVEIALPRKPDEPALRIRVTPYF
ncbi:MAG: hypothetical protein MUE47_01640 [Acidobacteria bacterium]|nr:hypothetical protein [Acidobacteriota bacterium]